MCKVSYRNSLLTYIIVGVTIDAIINEIFALCKIKRKNTYFSCLLFGILKPTPEQ